MTINLHTLQADVLHIEFQRGWRWDDLRSVIAQADSYIVSQPQNVHVVIDLRNAGGIPRDFMQVAGELFAQGDARPNEGFKVVVGAGTLMRTAYHGLRRVYALHDRPILFARDVPEALEIIRTTNPEPPE